MLKTRPLEITFGRTLVMPQRMMDDTEVMQTMRTLLEDASIPLPLSTSNLNLPGCGQRKANTDEMTRNSRKRAGRDWEHTDS